MRFFDDEFDSDETIEALLPAFPLRVRIGSMGKQYSRTGSEIAGEFCHGFGWRGIGLRFDSGDQERAGDTAPDGEVGIGR